jgi:glycosyltransferase involved in cell wall biosynthesis
MPREQQKKPRAEVSLGLFVKNEEATLETTLQSVADLVDEVVVLVDDTSTDRTMDIAKQYAHVVDSFTWDDNFAAARNQVLDKCTKEWVLLMDGHELLHPKSRPVLVALLERVMPGRDLADTEIFSAMIYMNPENVTDIEKIIPNIFFLQPRLFKNNGKHRYTGRVHNWLATEQGYDTKKRPVNELVIIHQRTPENAKVRKSQRAEMNIELLKKDIEENPEVSRPYFYLGNTYNELNMHDEAIEWYLKYLEISSWNAEKAQACLQLASIYSQREDWKTTKDWLYKGLAFDWERPEFYMLMGDIAFEHKQWYAAEHWYLCAKDMKPPLHGMFLHGPAYSYLPYMKLAATYSQVGQWFEALKNGEKAISLGAAGDEDNRELGKKMELWKRNLKMDPTRKNLILYDDTQRYTFLNDFAKRIAQDLNVAKGVHFDVEYAAWANYVFMEWCHNNAAEMSHWPKPNGQIRVVRLHSYELYHPDVMAKMNWRTIDALVFVAKHVKQRFLDLYANTIPPSLRLEVIPNAVDVNGFSFAKRENSTKTGIAWVGVFTEKKGVERLAMTIRYFAKHHPEYKFLIRTDVPRSYSISYFAFMHDIQGLSNWEIVPRQDSMDRFYEDCKYVLSTSNLEAFSYIVAEGMAKGIKPLIYNWWGAKDLWPHELIWDDFEELEKVLSGKYQSERYRKWVQEHYGVNNMVARIKDLFEQLGGPLMNQPQPGQRPPLELVEATDG